MDSVIPWEHRGKILEACWMRYRRAVERLGDKPTWFGRKRWQRRRDSLRLEHDQLANEIAFGSLTAREVLDRVVTAFR